MAAVRRKQDSDSSEEDLERFREAAWETPGADRAVLSQEKTTHPSLRVRPDCHEHDGNELQTTPEFRCHVAKKLSSILDSSIKEVPGKHFLQTDNPENSSSENDDFRLFGTSLLGDAGKAAISPVCKRKVASSSEEENQQRFQEAAVSADDILRHSALHQSIPTLPPYASEKHTHKKKRKKKKKKDDEAKVNTKGEMKLMETENNRLHVKKRGREAEGGPM